MLVLDTQGLYELENIDFELIQILIHIPTYIYLRDRYMGFWET